VIRALSVLSAIVLVAGVVVVFTGALPLAILLIVLGLAGLALAFAVSEAKRLYVSCRSRRRRASSSTPTRR
jgi:hypothetical protein